MKNNSWKKVLSFGLALALTCSLAGCKDDDEKKTGGTPSPTPTANTSPSPSPSPTADPDDGKYLKDGTEISMMVSSHASWPYDPNWIVWKYIEEATNAKIKVTAVPDEEWETKVNLMMASKKDMPDLLHAASKPIVDTHSSSGAFVDIIANIDKTPNFKAWRDSTPEAPELITQRTSGDGNVYYYPTYGLHTINNMRCWMYRKDIFEKNNLAIPKDSAEMFETAKKLKEIYPDSYPIGFRNGLNEIASQWDEYMQLGVYYDFNTEKWGYGWTADAAKEMAEYYIKALDAKLVPPDYLTISSESWQELVSTNRSFMMPDYIIRIDFFNGPARKADPNYTWATMQPPKGTNATASSTMTKGNFEFSGFTIMNTGNQERIDNAMKFVDWYYSADGMQILSWGKEGETYEVKDVKKQFIKDEKGTPARNLYGIGSLGTYQIVTPEANEALYTEENVKSAREALNYLAPKAPPLTWLPLTAEELEKTAQAVESIKTYASEEYTKFLLKQSPLTDATWKAYVARVKELGIDEVLAIYAAAYDRVK